MSGAGFTYCPKCATPLALRSELEDGGAKERLRCPACDYTYWNNPTPVLAAVITCPEHDDRILLARNAAWPHRTFALITGFMEAGESPEQGVSREVKEETALDVKQLSLLGVWEFLRMNQVIIAYHAVARGEVRLSPELAEYKLYTPEAVRCWPAGTGYALAEYLRRIGHEPQFIEFPKR